MTSFSLIKYILHALNEKNKHLEQKAIHLLELSLSAEAAERSAGYTSERI